MIPLCFAKPNKEFCIKQIKNSRDCCILGKGLCVGNKIKVMECNGDNCFIVKVNDTNKYVLDFSIANKILLEEI